LLEYGSGLIVDGTIERGTIFTVLYSVLWGSYALGLAGPQIGVLAGAKGAGASIFEIIDKVSVS
jgi:ATP-binding cassette subfamily B (MDR/TAP) protein 1